MTLEVGKLADELGGLVGLREPRRLDGGISAAKLLGELPQPLVLSANDPAPAKYVIEPRRPASASIPAATSRSNVNGGILEPRLQHLGVARAHELRVAAVDDHGEAVPLDREVALVRLHRRDDHLRRELQEPLVEAAFEHVWILDKMHDLGELAAGVAPPADRVEPGDDPRALVGDAVRRRWRATVGIARGRPGSRPRRA